jgi:hypothetical protein
MAVNKLLKKGSNPYACIRFAHATWKNVGSALQVLLGRRICRKRGVFGSRNATIAVALVHSVAKKKLEIGYEIVIKQTTRPGSERTV